MPRYLIKIFIILLLLIFNGCTDQQIEVISEIQEKHYLRGKSLLREGRKQEALEAFLKVVNKRDDAAESHLESGRLSLTHIKDPIAAIYHFRKYLELKPDATQSKLVRQLIETAQKDFARSLPGQPFEGEFERLDLMNLIEQLKNENLELKKTFAESIQRFEKSQKKFNLLQDQIIAHAQSQAAENENNPTQNVQPVTPPAVINNVIRPEVYIVQPGDTLSRISRKLYNTPGRWRDIFNANRDVLPSPHAIRVGQELRVP